MTKVSSTYLAAVGYDPKTKVLQIRFRNGFLATYDNVPESIYKGLMAAPSKGKYFHANIKGLPYR